jgi:hypothetical protein
MNTGHPLEKPIEEQPIEEQPMEEEQDAMP